MSEPIVPPTTAQDNSDPYDNLPMTPDGRIDMSKVHPGARPAANMSTGTLMYDGQPVQYWQNTGTDAAPVQLRTIELRILAYFLSPFTVDSAVSIATGAGLDSRDFHYSEHGKLFDIFMAAVANHEAIDTSLVGYNHPDLLGTMIDAQTQMGDLTDTLIHGCATILKEEAAKRAYYLLANDLLEAVRERRFGDAHKALTSFHPYSPAAQRKFWTVSELYAADFPEPTWLVPGMLTTGLTLLAGRPKQGKSWLALALATAIASGGRALDAQVERRKVLYVDLETDAQSIRERLVAMKTPAGIDLDLWTVGDHGWQSLGDGGLVDLDTAITRNGYQLVVLDTLSRALGTADQMDLAEMTVIVGALQRLATERNVAIVAIDHHKKATALDSIDDISGSTGKAAVADCAWGLYRKRGDANATLHITGRRIRDRELALRWADETSCWQLVGDAETVKKDSVQSEVLIAIQESGGRANLRTVAEFVGKDRSFVYREIQELVNKRKLSREQTGKEVFYRVSQEG